MAVYYKFKSARDYDSIAMDGPFISVGTLKEKIFESKHLGRGTDFDLVVTNAQTNEEYLDEAMLIPKNTSVLIRRVPGRPRMPIVADPTPKVEEAVENIEPEKTSLTVAHTSSMKCHDDLEWDDLGGDLYEIPDMTQVHSSNVIPEAPPTNTIDEDSKIKALIDTPALDWQRQGPDGFGPGRGFGRGMVGRMTGGRGFGMERKTPPQGYVCHRCKVPGHFIQHCPTNGDPTFDIRRVKPPTGIPKSMLMATPDGSYALPSGAVAVLRPNEAAFEKEIEGLPSTTRSVGDLPPELHCPLCKEVMKDAVLTSKCCFKSFCDKCIRDYIISRSMCICGATNILADDLLPNKTLRDTISRILESGNSSENAGSTFQLQDMESARCPQPKIPSPTMSAASKGEEKLLPRNDEAPKVQETVEEAKPVIVTQQQEIENARMPKIPDVSEATHESMSVKEPASQGSAPLVEEEVQQKLAGVDPGKKKKKKKARVPTNNNDVQWKGPPEIPGENYVMPPHMGMTGPSTYNPYWGGMPMQPGMDGYNMPPFPPPMPYNMGYAPYAGPLDMHFGGGFMPHDPYAVQPMFPGIPPQHMGMNMQPPPYSKEEFEARKANARRNREMVERRGESRELPKDRDFSREVSSGVGPTTKPNSTLVNRSPSPDYHRRHHRPERSSIDRPTRDLDPRRPLKRKSDHEYDYHHHDRETSDHHHNHNNHHRRRRSESSGRPSSESSGKAAAVAVIPNSGSLDRKHKASVFSRISFPPEGEASKKHKVSSSTSTDVAAPGGDALATTHHKSNGYHDDQKSASTKVSVSVSRRSVEYETSDDDHDCHFKRRPSRRYEPSPPPPAVVDAEEPPKPKHSRGSREQQRDRTKHR